MATNVVDITIKDRTKQAVCKEILALCSGYELHIAGDWPEGASGFVVIHRIVPPHGVVPRTYDGAIPVRDRKASTCEIYSVTQVSGGTCAIELSNEDLVNDLLSYYCIDSVVPVRFSFYASRGDGDHVDMVGCGHVMVKVVHPYGKLTEVGGFELFKGPEGPQGQRGEKGEKGEKGDKGDKGDTGPQGPRGPEGARGPQGQAGARGADGRDGVDGANGRDGVDGRDGERGPQGIQGERGPKGDKGEKGDAGSQGLPGPRGPQGARGVRGDTGPQGPQGERGPAGPQGPQGPKGDPGIAGAADHISDETGSVIRADGSSVVIDGSWTCNGVVLTKKEGRDNYWENAERSWGLGYDSSAKWAFTNGSGYARSDAPADATKLSFVIGGVTYDATVGRADSVVMAGDVVPMGDGTETIATIGGKDIKAPASPVSSVNGKTGAVNLVAQDVGALALESANKVGSSFSMGFEGEETSGGNILFGVGMGPAGWAFVVNKFYCSGVSSLYANGLVITNTSNEEGASVLARIQEYGGDFKTALTEVNGLIGTALDATAAYPMSTVADGALKDRTVNHATAGGTFTFPERTGTNARDFVLVIDALETAPTVTFPGSYTYVSEQDAADIWTAEAGKVNAWYFSEVADSVFMVCHKAMGAVAQ